MENFFNDKHSDPSLDNDTDFKAEHFDFSMTGNSGTNAPGNTSLQRGVTDPYSSTASDFLNTAPVRTASQQRLEDERIRRENQNAFFGVPRKQDTDPRHAGNQKQPDVYGNSMQEIQDRADPEKLKWNWSGKVDDMFKPRQGDHAHNAVLTGLRSIGQLNPAEVSEPVLPESTGSLPGRVQQGWDHAGDGLSFRARPDYDDGKAERIRRIKNLPRFYEDGYQRARMHEDEAGGVARYINNYITGAHPGLSESDQVNNTRHLARQPVGAAYNQVALAALGGTLGSTPGRILSIGGDALNLLSQESGGGKLFRTPADFVKNINTLRKDIFVNDEENTFVTSDGKLTGLGVATKIAGGVAEIAPEALFVTGAARLWGEKALVAGAIPLDVVHSYIRDFQARLEEYEALPPELVFADSGIRERFERNRRWGMDDRQALLRAKRDVAQKQAENNVTANVVKNVVTAAFSRATPDEVEGFMLSMGKNGSLIRISEIIGNLLKPLFSNGSVLEAGDLGMTD